MTGFLRPNSGGIEMTVDTAQLMAIIAIIRDADLHYIQSIIALCICFS